MTIPYGRRVGNEDWFDDDDDQEDDFLEVLDEVDGEANSVATGEADTDTAAALHPEDSVHRAFRSTSVAPPPVLAAPPGAAGVGSAWVIGLGIAAIVVVSAFASKYVRNAWTSRSKRSSDKNRQPFQGVHEDDVPSENTTVAGSHPRRDVPDYNPTKNRSKLAAEARTMLNQFVDQLRSETEVDLSGKNLMDEGVEFVAEGLAYNNRCRVVHFGSNAVGQRACAQVAEVLKVNEALQELHLDTNQIDDDGAEALAAALATNKALKKLNLSANRIGDVGVAALAEMLKGNDTLESLDLSSNEIGYDGAVALAKALTENRGLKRLALSDNYIGTLGSSTIASAVSQNACIRSLALKGCELSDAGAERLCAALTGREADLEVLDIANNGLTAAATTPIASLLSGSTLKKINLNMNEFGDAGMYAIADALQKGQGLEELDVGGCNVGPEGAAVLMGALKGHKSLRTLELGYNPLGPEGVKTVAATVKFDLPLTQLRMGWCQAGDRAGAEYIGQLLQFNESLEEVDLRGNNLKDNGAMVIGRALRQMQNSCIKKIDLGYNEIQEDGAFTIANALKNNPENMPSVLCLQQNYISGAGKTALKEALEDIFDLYEIEMQIDI